MIPPRFIRPLATSITSLLFTLGASAATLDWDADGNASPALGGAGTWNTSGLNWTDGATHQAWVNAANNTAVFGGEAGGTVTIAVPVVVGGVVFGTPDYVLTGANLALGVIGQNTMVVNADATIESVIVGDAAASLAISGAGTLVLDGVNTYAGATSILDTTVEIETFGDGTGGNLGASGAVAISGGILRYTGVTGATGRSFAIGGASGGATLEVVQQDATLTLSGPVTGQARQLLTKTGAGTLVLQGAQDNGSGRLSLDEGTLVLAKESAPAVHSVGSQGGDDYALVINGGLVQIAGTGGDQIYVNSSVNMTGGVLDMNGRNEAFSQLFGAAGVVRNGAAATTSTLTLGENNGTAEFAGVLEDGQGTLALTKVGTGTVTLSGVNTYTGGTTVNGGVLLAAKLASLPGYQTPGRVTLNSGGGIVVRIGGADGWQAADLQTLRTTATFNAGSGIGIDTANGDFTYAEPLAGDLFFAKLGENTLLLNGNNSHIAGTRVLGGTLKLGSATAFGTGPVTINGGALDVNGFSIATPALTGGAVSELTNSAATDATVTINLAAGAVGAFQGTITTPSTGKLNLVLNALPSATGSNYSINGVSDFVGSVTVNGVGDVLGTRGVLGVPQSGGLGGASNVLTLNNGGTLANLSNPATTGSWPTFGIPELDNPVVLTGAAGGVFRAGYVGQGGGITINGVISGPGGLTKTDGGFLQLTADNTYEGGTRIAGGTLRLGEGGTTGSIPATSVVTFGTGTTNTLAFNREGETVFPNAIDKGGRANVSVGADQKVTYTGALSGTGEFWVSGPGTFVVPPNAATTGSGSIVTNQGAILEISDFSPQTLGSGNFFIGQGGTESTLRYTGASVSTGRLTGGTFQGSEVTLEITNPETTLTLTAILGNNATGLGPTVKEGQGSLAVTNANTYVGGTIVAEGALLVNSTAGSGTGPGALEVLEGGIIGGTGTIAPTGSSGIDVAGIIAPGVQLGTLTFNLASTEGAITLGEDAGFRFELGTAGTVDIPGASDRILLSGASAEDFLFAGNVINFGATGQEGWYRLFSTSLDASTWSGLTVDAGSVITGGLSVANLAPGLSGELVLGDGALGTNGHIYLHVVPEPGSAALLLGATAALLGFRRRRG